MRPALDCGRAGMAIRRATRATHPTSEILKKRRDAQAFLLMTPPLSFLNNGIPPRLLATAHQLCGGEYHGNPIVVNSRIYIVTKLLLKASKWRTRRFRWFRLPCVA